MRSTKVAVSLAALGAALLSTAAFAQNYPAGRAANDGGMVQAQTLQQSPTTGQRTGSASNAQATRPGGALYNSLYNSAAPQSTYPVGRAANDGGMVNPQRQGQ
jgi:hypothetical protein